MPASVDPDTFSEVETATIQGVKVLGVTLLAILRLS